MDSQSVITDSQRGLFSGRSASLSVSTPIGGILHLMVDRQSTQVMHQSTEYESVITDCESVITECESVITDYKKKNCWR